MKYDQIVASLIKRAIDVGAIQSHERVLLQRYSTAHATEIASELLREGQTVSVGLPEDDGSMSSIELPALICDADDERVELIAFVVTDAPNESEPDWKGSQGFASRLRTSFHLLAAKDTVRVLLLFDERPVETEQTTTSTELAASMDSLDSLVGWLESEEWQIGFDPSTLATSLEIVRWWRQRIQAEPDWDRCSHTGRLENATSFMASARACSSSAELGELLPQLGLLFSDPGLLSGVVKQLGDNAKIASELEKVRQARTVDPLVKADEILDMGSPDDPFRTELVAALRSPRELVTRAQVTLTEIQNRLRTQHRRPAFLDVRGLQAQGLSEGGDPQGEGVTWRFIDASLDAPKEGDSGRPAQRTEIHEIVIPCPSARLRLTFPVLGDLRSFVSKTGGSQPPHEEDLEPNEDKSFTFEVSQPQPSNVVQLLVRERRAGRARPSPPSQIIRIAVVAGDRIVIPQNSALDAERNAFVVDATADTLKVQVGSAEVLASDQLPDLGGNTTIAEIDGVRFRWVGEEPSPEEDEDQAPRQEVRLVELVGIRTTGNPLDGQPYFTESGGLAASTHTSAKVDVSELELRLEAELIAQPEVFVGVAADNEAAVAELRRFEPELFAIWLESRVSFFRGVRESCEQRIPGLGGSRATMYLANLRDEPLATTAEAYVSAYANLIESITAHVRTASQPSLIEPLLLCDRAFESPDSVGIAPTHPVAVAMLASLQRGLLADALSDPDDWKPMDALLQKSPLGGVLPWLPWRGNVLDAAQDGPLLWRRYGTQGGSLDTSHDLCGVIVQKVRRLLALAPHLNVLGQRVHLNIDIGKGNGAYLVEALRALEKDDTIGCTLDIGIVLVAGSADPLLVEVFSGAPSPDTARDRERFHGFVRVCKIESVYAREAHLVFRMEAADPDKSDFGSISESNALVRDTGFAGGLLHEPVRFANTTSNDVKYTRYVASDLNGSQQDGAPEIDTLWDGRWRRHFQRLVSLSRRAAVGLRSPVGVDSFPCQTLRQIAVHGSHDEYAHSFITVHCDAAQGPEFFLGDRTARSRVFLVECSDRGSPQLPGRDIVSVTARISPFRAALSAAVGMLPAPLSQLVNDGVARGILQDVNLLRGTEVFDFFRSASRERSHIHFMDGLDNILALRFLLSSEGGQRGRLPLVVSMRDFASRSDLLGDLRSGTKCDDILVFYLPASDESDRAIYYRLVEVKFGRSGQGRKKARQQLSETGQKLSALFPAGQWDQERSPRALLLERDIAWIFHEVLERYRAFGLVPDEDDLERRWGLKALFNALHRGDFEVKPYAAHSNLVPVNGTALMLDPDVPGLAVSVDVESATEYVTIPQGRVGGLLVTTSREIFSDGLTSSPEEPVSGVTLTAYEDQATTKSSPAWAAEECDTPVPLVRSAEEVGEQRNELETRPNAAARPMDIAASEEGLSDEVRDAAAHVEEGFRGFVGNVGAVKRLKRMLTIARLQGDSSIRSIGLYGPKSTGKTELAHRVARVLDLPTLELSEILLRSADDLAEKIRETAAGAGTPMRIANRDSAGRPILKAPPMVVFIDEVHLLKKRVQDSLLKALAPSDRTLLSTEGTIDTRDVSFVIATTDPGELGSAFKSRVTRIDLREYSVEELVAILDAHRRHNPRVSHAAEAFDGECLLIFARVGRQVPRQAIELMSETAEAVSAGMIEPTSTALRAHFKDEQQADELGLTDRDRAYLEALFPDKTVGEDALAAQLGEVVSSISSDMEPYLLRLGLIERSTKGRKLTARGQEFVGAFLKQNDGSGG